MPLTPKQKKKYLDQGGVRCPFCDSDQLEGDGFGDEQSSSEHVRCLTCPKEWYDDYKLVAIREYE